jgi:two-component system, NarL family, nitrate/nitrite response regulator NarL
MSREPPIQIRVLIADAKPLFREALARTIRSEPGLRLIAELAAGADVRDAIHRLSPDVAIVDAALGGLGVVEAAAQHRLSTRIVLMSDAVRPGDAFEAVAAGAHGYLSRQANGAAVCRAVRRVAAGADELCDEAQGDLTKEVRLRYRSERRLLAPRELEVLTLMADGLNNTEIGMRLHLAPGTVKSYAARIYQRLGVRDRLGAVLEGMRRGLLD